MGQWSKNNQYTVNRGFSDFVHQQIAIPYFYNAVNWKEMYCDPEILEKVDRVAGIDYFFKDLNKVKDNVYGIQERFRSVETAKYDDFTVTFKRGSDPRYKHHHAEHFKMRSDYMVYGIVNSDTINYRKNCNKFLKFVLVDCKELYIELLNKTIQLSNSAKTEECKVVVEVRVKNDENVTFLTYSVPKLIEHFGDRIIKFQDGYL